MARDKRDRLTRDAFRGASNAERQAAYKARMRAQGYRQRTLWVHQDSYAAGVEAAELGSTNASNPPADVDPVSWGLGYVERLAEMRGKAAG